MGIPTANLPIDPKEALDNLLIPGIYKGKCVLTSVTNHNLLGILQQEIDCLISIGFNPMYNQLNLNLEVLILKDFKGLEFYGSKVNL